MVHLRSDHLDAESEMKICVWEVFCRNNSCKKLQEAGMGKSEMHCSSCRGFMPAYWELWSFRVVSSLFFPLYTWHELFTWLFFLFFPSRSFTKTRLGYETLKINFPWFILCSYKSLFLEIVAELQLQYLFCSMICFPPWRPQLYICWIFVTCFINPFPPNTFYF